MSTKVIAFYAGAPDGGSVIATGRIYAPHRGGTAYPRTVGGITLGTTDNLDISILDAAGWVEANGDDPVLRGRWRVENTGVRTLRVDEAPGQYDFGALLASATFQRTRLRVYDGPATGTPLLDFSSSNPSDAPPSWPNADEFQDFATLGSAAPPPGTPAGVWRPIDADAFTPAPFTRRATLTNTYFTLQLGGHDPASFFSELSAFFWTPVAPAGLSPALARRRRGSMMPT